MHTIPVATDDPELEGSTMERSQEVSGHHTHIRMGAVKANKAPENNSY